MSEHDPVNRPSHYIGDGLEVIDVIEDWELGFHLGNALKYILRSGRKGDRIEDIEKARWYIERAKRPGLIDLPLPRWSSTIEPARVTYAFRLPVYLSTAVLMIHRASRNRCRTPECLERAGLELDAWIAHLTARAA
ncbi:MAG: DUF3310 domain-containing protein [Burkholderiaceae bacterium]